MAGGGSGGGSSTNTVQNTNAYIPQWLSDYGQAAVQSAAQLSSQPYQPYTGQTVAGWDPYQTQAYGQIGGMQGPALGVYNQGIGQFGNMLGQAQPITGGSIMSPTNALNTNFVGNVYDPATGLFNNSYNNAGAQLGGGYSNAANMFSGSYNNAAGLLGNYMGQGGANQIGANAQALMSPYINSVIGPSMQLGQQALAQNLQQIGAGANQAGAFGGSRQGVQEGVAQAQTALGESQYMGNMLNAGWNAALTPALLAEQQGYGAANTLAGYGQSNANALAQMGMQNAGLMAGYGQTNATNLAQMLGSGYAGALGQGGSVAQQNLSAGMAAPDALNAMEQYGLGNTQALNAAGQQAQQYQQNLLNAGYGQYMQAQAWPYQQLQAFLGAIGGIPYSVTNESQQQTQMPSNLLGQAIGGVSALGGLAGGVGSILGGNQSATGR